MGQSIFEKTWASHTVAREEGQTLLYVDRLIVAESSRHAFQKLREEGHAIRRPGQIIALADHYTATAGAGLSFISDPERVSIINTLEANAREYGITYFGLDDPRRGIQHVVSCEQALAQPGIVMLCSDSHTSTQAALGAIAFGIGGELAHVLATQCIWHREPPQMRITLDGHLPEHVTAKDVILATVATVGVGGAAGYAVEYAGEAIASMTMEGRMTVCNMSVEMGARAGIIGPDETTFAYLHGRPYAPKGAAWERAVAFWRALRSDPDAIYAREARVDVSRLEPMVTWGNSPENALPINGVVPDPDKEPDAQKRASMVQSLDYMDLKPGDRLNGLKIDRVFIGSCTNSRIEDLRAAAAVVQGRRGAVPTLVVPGSGLVKAQAEAEGLDAIFKDAGFSWGEPGCSMCVSMNGDMVRPGERCASTSNRNFQGRQGRGSRTHLMSPASAAAAAVTGRLTDVRTLIAGV